jgi:hypothetical protein
MKANGHCFPTLSYTAYGLYVAAYKEKKTYDEYTQSFDKMQPAKYKPKPKPKPEIGDGSLHRPRKSFLHRPHHDMESVIWVLIDGLVHAWPVGSELEITKEAKSIMLMFYNHNVDGIGDTRSGIDKIQEEQWLAILHPQLGFLAGMMAELSKFLYCDWSLWMIRSDDDNKPLEPGVIPLKPDFLHEALKRILLQAIVWNEGHMDIQLKKQVRYIPGYSYPFDYDPNSAILREGEGEVEEEEEEEEVEGILAESDED